MKTKFKDLLKGIFLTSVASLISSNEANAISYDLSRISDVRVEGELVGERDRVLVVHVNRQRGRRNRNAGGRRNVLAGNLRGNAARQFNAGRLHGQLTSVGVEHRLLDRAAAGDGGSAVCGKRADGGAAGRQDAAGLLIGNVPDSCIQRQADAAAVHFKIGEAACSRCQIALGQRRRGFYLGGADVGVAGRNDLRGQSGRIGDDHLECGNISRYYSTTRVTFVQ